MPLKVCYLLSHGFAARMVLHSDLVPQLVDAGIDTMVLAPQSAKGSLGKFAREHLSITTVPLEKSRIRMSLGDARRYLREPIRENAALWSRHLYFANGMAGTYAKYRARLNYFAHRVLFRSRWAHRIFDAFDRSRHRSKLIRAKLAELKPDLVVATYPVTSFEVAALLEAQKIGISTVGHLLSWDNITCKGRFPAVPQHFISWGPIMTAELKEHYGIEDDHIYECGVPHFDAHKQLVDRAQQQSTLLDLGLDPAKPFLFFGMSAPIFAPHEIDVVEWLAKRIVENRFGFEMQLVIRPHPQNVSGNMADTTWLPRLQAVVGPRIGLNLPLLSEGGLDWDMQQDDLKILVNLLAGCSVSLNSGSTLSIDALAHDKPVIVTLFDADQKLPWWKSARRIREYPHYKKLLALGGVSAVSSFAELETEILAYIADPAKRSSRRLETIAAECHAIDGRSSKRVAEALRDIAARKK